MIEVLDAKVDAQRLRTIRLRALRDAPDAFAANYEENAARPASVWVQQLEDLHTLVAVRDGADVGMVRGVIEGERAWLLSMWVAPEARGHGVGEALITALVDWARRVGAAEVALDVGDHNQPAIALYARMGFEPNGVTGTLPEPRQAVTEHQRVLVLRAERDTDAQEQ